MEDLKELQRRYESLKGLGLKLNIERGQPGDENFDLSNALFPLSRKRTSRHEADLTSAIIPAVFWDCRRPVNCLPAFWMFNRRK